MIFVPSHTDAYLQWKREGPRSSTKIDKEILKEKEIMIFVQETHHEQLNKMQWVTLTQEFTKLHEVTNVRRYGYNVRLDNFLDLKICHIDMARVMEFLKTFDKHDVATITNH